MSSLPNVDCVVCCQFVEEWMPGTLCSTCAAFAPEAYWPILWASRDTMVRPQGKQTLQHWKTSKADALGMPPGGKIEGRSFTGEFLPEEWRDYLYRWVGRRVVNPPDHPSWPMFRAGDLCYQQWERTVLFPDRRLWLTARWHPDRGGWIETPVVGTKGDWDRLWTKGIAAIQEVSKRGNPRIPLDEDVELVNQAIRVVRASGQKVTQVSVAAVRYRDSPDPLDSFKKQLQRIKKQDGPVWSELIVEA